MPGPVYIRKNAELVRRKLVQRHTPALLEEVENFDRQRRQLLQETEQIKHRRNRTPAWSYHPPSGPT